MPACFCFPCRMFHVEQAGSKDKFIKLGFSDWKHATGKSGILSVHDRCASHRQAMESWPQYKLNTQPGLVLLFLTGWSQVILSDGEFCCSK